MMTKRYECRAKNTNDTDRKKFKVRIDGKYISMISSIFSPKRGVLSYLFCLLRERTKLNDEFKLCIYGIKL